MNNFIFFSLLLLFHKTSSLKNIYQGNVIPSEGIPDLQKIAHDNEVKFLDMLQETINKKRQEIQTQKEQQKQQQQEATQSMQQQQQSGNQLLNQQELSEAKEDIKDFYNDYEEIKRDIEKEYQKRFGFCKKSIFTISEVCKKEIENTKEKIAFYNISADLFNTTKKEFQKYKDDVDKMNGAFNVFKDYSVFLEENNSLEHLLDVIGDLYSAYPNLEDKYNVTTGALPHEEEQQQQTKEIDKQIKQINNFNDEDFKEVQKALTKIGEGEIGEKLTAALLNQSLPQFKKNEKVNNLLEIIKKDKELEEYVLDRDAKGQMLLNKLSWYLDYNTKNEEDMLQKIEMLKLRILGT